MEYIFLTTGVQFHSLIPVYVMHVFNALFQSLASVARVSDLSGNAAFIECCRVFIERG